MCVHITRINRPVVRHRPSQAVFAMESEQGSRHPDLKGIGIAQEGLQEDRLRPKHRPLPSSQDITLGRIGSVKGKRNIVDMDDDSSFQSGEDLKIEIRHVAVDPYDMSRVDKENVTGLQFLEERNVCVLDLLRDNLDSRYGVQLLRGERIDALDVQTGSQLNTEMTSAPSRWPRVSLRARASSLRLPLRKSSHKGFGVIAFSREFTFRLPSKWLPNLFL